MKAECSHCGSPHILPDAQLKSHSRVQFRCSKCGKSTVVEVGENPNVTRVISPLPTFARSAGAPGLRRNVADEEDTLHLPEGKALSLSVISGPSRGLVYSISKPRIVLGRKDADLELNDPEISRWHCAIEIKGEVVRLRDLDSTNGTFFADERVRAAELKHLAEFRIGSSIIMLTITPKLVPVHSIPD